MKKIFSKLLSIIIFSYIIYSCCIYINLYISAGKVPDVQNQEFLRFKIYGYSYNGDEKTISANFAIIDDRGYEISQIERSWNGNYLAVEFCQAELRGKYYIFPKKIFAKERIIENSNSKNPGIYLEKYYTENNECILIGQKKDTEKRQCLYTISRFANKKYFLPSFNYVSTYVIDLSDCISETYYSISCNSEGKITLHQM